MRYRDPAAGAAHLTTQLEAGLDSLLAGELHPAFVIADTNWGDGSEKFVQVVAPDPVTGEARLWQKSTTTGKMTPMDDDWVSDGWSVQKEPA